MEQRVREHIRSTVKDGLILTAFQPIHDLSGGAIGGISGISSRRLRTLERMKGRI
ncbi:hypothetical protein [Pseudarthrobacter sp. W1I19]|uniref:hypothetical protein n=1 Tax=Pseudarthrobacter sp. W1I19 TaxID=3042288 RepID=UPI0027D88FCC|nr:hypothetical protein [Pseudarthrobacter sp. W1I19]